MERKGKPCCDWHQYRQHLQCKACFRKWVSLVNNRIDNPSDYWENNPWESEFLDDIKNPVYNGKWRGKEDKDILKAMILKGNWKV